MQYLIIYASILFGLISFIWILERDEVLAALKVSLIVTVAVVVGIVIKVEATKLESIDYSHNVNEALDGIDRSDRETTFIGLREYFTGTLKFSAFTCIKRDDEYIVSFYSQAEGKMIKLEVKDGKDSREGSEK